LWREVDIPNAAVSPHGIVVIHSGIFAAAETDDELAAVFSHEIAHVLAHHPEANVSSSIIAAIAGIPALPFVVGAMFVLELAVFAAPPLIVGSLIMLALNRGCETEADEIGMLLMTEAGFDPTATVSFWEKMTTLEVKVREAAGVEQEAEYKSTHPHVRQKLDFILHTADDG